MTHVSVGRKVQLITRLYEEVQLITHISVSRSAADDICLRREECSY